MSTIKRTLVFSQRILSQTDIAEIAAAMQIENMTMFVRPAIDIPVSQALKDLKNFGQVIFADQDTHSLYNLTSVLDDFIAHLEKYASPEDKLSDATMAYLVVE